MAKNQHIYGWIRKEEEDVVMPEAKWGCLMGVSDSQIKS